MLCDETLLGMAPSLPGRVVALADGLKGCTKGLRGLKPVIPPEVAGEDEEDSLAKLLDDVHPRDKEIEAAFPVFVDVDLG